MKCPKCNYNSFEYLDSCKKCNNDLAAFKQSHGIRAIVIPLHSRTAGAAVAAGSAALAAAASLAPGIVDEPAAVVMPAAAAAVKPGDDIFGDLGMDFVRPAAPAPPEEAFSFDLDSTTDQASPTVSSGSSADLADFSFDQPPLETTAEQPPAFEAPPTADDAFASLLETGSEGDTPEAPAPLPAPELESPWESPTNSFGSFDEQTAAPDSPAAATAAGGLDLENFNWEEPAPEPEPQRVPGSKVALEGFSSDEFDSLFGAPDEEKG